MCGVVVGEQRADLLTANGEIWHQEPPIVWPTVHLGLDHLQDGCHIIYSEGAINPEDARYATHCFFVLSYELMSQLCRQSGSY
jgi:hypothetical protein